MTMRDLWCLLLLSLPGVRYHNKSALTLGTHIVCTFADPNYFQILVSTLHGRCYTIVNMIEPSSLQWALMCTPSPHYLLQALRKPGMRHQYL
ncbi:hypothetical protein BDR07DRAFT_1437619, partial [Suillus spraguei]